MADEDVLASMGLNLSTLEEALDKMESLLNKQVSATEKASKSLDNLEKTSSKAAKSQKELADSTKKVSDSTEKTAKSVGLMGDTLKVVATYFAASKIAQFSKDIYEAYHATGSLNRELKEVSATANKPQQFQTAGEIQSKIAAAQAAIQKGGDALGIGAAGQSENIGAQLEATNRINKSSFFQTVIQGFKANFPGRFAKSQATEVNTEFQEQQSAINALARLREMAADKQLQQQKNIREATFGNTRAAEKAEVDRQLQEKKGGYTQLGSAAALDKQRKADIDLANEQKAEIDKRHDMVDAANALELEQAKIRSTGIAQQLAQNQAQIESIQKITDGTIKLTDVEKDEYAVRLAQLQQQKEFIQREQDYADKVIAAQAIGAKSSARQGELLSNKATFDKESAGLDTNSPQYLTALSKKQEADSATNKKFDIQDKTVAMETEVARLAAVGYSLQIQTVDAKIKLNEELLKTVDLGKEEKAQIELQNAELAKQKKELQEQYQLELINASLGLQAQEAQIDHNDRLAALAAVRAQYEGQIVQALREGKKELAETLAKEEALAGLAAKVDWYRKTPKEKRDARKEQRDQEHAERTIIDREFDKQDRIARGAYGQVDSNAPHQSKATQAYIKQYESVFGKIPKGVQAGDHVAEIATHVNSIDSKITGIVANK